MRYVQCLVFAMISFFMFADEVKVLHYGDFGAKGDGQTNDFEALLKTHKYANEHKLPVQADDNATYLIKEATEAIPIMTDTNWGKAHFIIDDRGDLKCYRLPVFLVCSRIKPFKVKGMQPLKRGQTSIGVKLPMRAVLLIFDAQTKRFIRYGTNANDGSPQVDVILVDKDGNIDGATPVNWDFNSISSIKVYPVDETPLHIKGGIFKTFTNDKEGRHAYYHRNISIRRSNTIVDGVRHEVVEPGGLDSWPYAGFISVSDCAEVIVQNCEVSGRRVYGWLQPEKKTRKTTGTYDISCTRALKVKFINVNQINDILDHKLWGVMGSNFCKSLTLEKCRLSRFDAHQGVTNAIIKDCEMGYMGINAIGFGTFIIENTVNHSSNFVNFRNDYGATWHGDFIIKNCKFIPESRHRDANVFGGKATPTHNFGYQCSMPETIKIEGLEIDLSKLSAKFRGMLFSNFVSCETNKNSPYPYQVTKRLDVKGIIVKGGKWIFTSNPKLFSELEVKGVCPGYDKNK